MYGTNDGAWTEENQHVSRDCFFNEIDVDFSRTSGDDSQSVVIDYEWRMVLKHKFEDLCVSMQNGQLLV